MWLLRWYTFPLMIDFTIGSNPTQGLSFPKKIYGLGGACNTLHGVAFSKRVKDSVSANPGFALTTSKGTRVMQMVEFAPVEDGEGLLEHVVP